MCNPEKGRFLTILVQAKVNYWSTFDNSYMNRWKCRKCHSLDLQVIFLGYIRDNLNHPVPNAKIEIKENNYTVFSNKEGRYVVELEPGKYTIKVSSGGYQSSTKYIEVSNIKNLPKYVMFTLTKETNVMGLPRLVFIIFAGEFELNNPKHFDS